MLDEEAIGLMLDRDTYLVADLYDGDYILENGPHLGYSAEVLRKAEATTQVQREGFRSAVGAGVRIAFGSDAGVFPHGSQGRQFALYVDHGLSPARAIQSATRWAAELLGREHEIGSIAPGMYADLVAVTGNPMDDIRLLERIDKVMCGGRWTTTEARPHEST